MLGELVEYQARAMDSVDPLVAYSLPNSHLLAGTALGGLAKDQGV